MRRSCCLLAWSFFWLGLWTRAAMAQAVDPELLLQQATTAQQRGESATAVRDYGEALRGHPELVQRVEAIASAEAYLAAGQLRFGVGQFDLARRDADAAEHLNPKLAGLATLQGMILEQTSDYDGAEAALRQAVAMDPADFNAQLYLGAVYYFKRETVSARSHLARALALQPRSAQARYELALVARAEGKLNEAVEDLQAVVRQVPDWMQPHVELSALYYQLHRDEDGARERELVDRMMTVQQQRLSQSAHP